MQDNQADDKTIAVIGGGLGGCLTALMLARQGYHVKIIEAKSVLLDGASLLAARLHLGGEYPIDPTGKTGLDCLKASIIWKLLMPDDIYTSVPPMKFLVDQETERLGELSKDDPKSLTVGKFIKYYETIHLEYEKLFTEVKSVFGSLFGNSYSDAAADTKLKEKLFGDPKQFHRELLPEEYEYSREKNFGYTNIAGGFQSPEKGLNIPKYLAMLQAEIEKQQEAGKIEVILNHKVKKVPGELGNFEIKCENGKTIGAAQVVESAWQGGPAITPQLGPIIDEDKKNESKKQVMVYKRAMLLVTLPKGWKTPPAFTMLGENGGMIAPFNDKVALCYLPGAATAYVDKVELKKKPYRLPSFWDDTSDSMSMLTPEQIAGRTNDYFKRLKERFPILKGASNPRLLIRDTLTLHEAVAAGLEARPNEHVNELRSVNNVPPRISLRQQPEQIQELEVKLLERDPLIETKPGYFTLYPTKATYAAAAALQAAFMVNKRRERPADTFIWTYDPYHELMNTPGMREQYSLEHIPQPTPQAIQKFLTSHPDLDYPGIMENTWLGKTTQPSPPTWVERDLRKPPLDGRMM